MLHAFILAKIKSQLFFGTKRKITAKNVEVWFKISLMWRLVSPLIARRVGFLPAKKIGFGSDDETIKSHLQGMHWTKSKDWIDSDDGFDYQHACANIQWPPTWFMAATNDKALGHPKDVKLFMTEANHQQAKYTLLAKSEGFAEDYDHISMLTGASAVDGHFVLIGRWLKGI